MYERLVIGIDQSYKRTGISIACDGKLMVVKSMDFNGLNDNTLKRHALSEQIEAIIVKNFVKTKRIEIICERIRTFSGGFISTNYIKSTGALIATIVDIAYKYNVPVYSVDTRSWKSQIIGTSKGGKQPAIEFIERLGFSLCLGTDKNGNKIYNDDAADSACIALYGFIPEIDQKLTLEC